MAITKQATTLAVSKTSLGQVCLPHSKLTSLQTQAVLALGCLAAVVDSGSSCGLAIRLIACNCKLCMSQLDLLAISKTHMAV